MSELCLGRGFFIVFVHQFHTKTPSLRHSSASPEFYDLPICIFNSTHFISLLFFHLRFHLLSFSAGFLSLLELLVVLWSSFRVSPRLSTNWQVKTASSSSSSVMVVDAAASSGTSKQLKKLEKRVQDGEYYEAQQMYKSVNSRYLHAKKYSDSISLLASGAIAMLNHGQVTCGTELGLLLIQTMNVAKVPFDKSAIDQIRAIYNAYPRVTNSQDGNEASPSGVEFSEAAVAARTRVEGCTSFLRAALKWSMESGELSRGAPELHDMLAVYMWTESPAPEMLKVSQHFVRGNQPETFARVVVDCMSQCYPSEADLVIARAVLLYLSLGNLRDANRLLDSVRQRLSDNSEAFPDSPLLHFVKFLLSTLERDALPLFRMLRQKYKPSLERDPSLDEYLDEIAERFYNVPRRNGMQGMLGDFMKMFAMDS